jgi:hypothetical protein
MSHLLIAVGAAIAVAAVVAPIAAIFLVSVASRREESAHTLSGRAPGPITRAARRLLVYRTQSESSPAQVARQDLRVRLRSSAPRPRGSQAGKDHARPAIEPLAIRLVPDAAQARREPAGTHAA